MRIELIMTGEELLDGRVLNANEATITGLLCEEGWQVSRSVTVGDDPLELETAITEACSRSEIVIMTGGLGPTDDDRTSAVIACCLETPLVLNQRVLDGLMARYKKRGMVMPESNRKQAMIPDSATLISNPNGTAPGYRCSFKKALLFALPGVPSEMKVMLLDDVIPTLKKEFSIDLPACGSIRLTCFGCGESEIADRLTPLYPLAEGVEIGYQVTFPEIRIIIKYRDPVVLKDSFVYLKQSYKKMDLNFYLFSSVFLTFILEIWPLKSSGSFFTNWNATFFWIIVSLIISILYEKNRKLYKKTDS